ncbi:MAG: bifunctional DNA-formamidopyrimidine glycosylase/DNA-(apurinic or apyrimidinic site) lyase [Planctomycetota bacterium]
MPELPEVEHLRRTLVPHLVGRSVVRATLHRRDIAVGPGDPPGGFARQRSRVRPRRLTKAQMLQGAVIDRIDRRGKLMAIIGDDGRAIGVHLGMSGQVLWAAAGGRLSTDHVHATWRLDDGSRFVFRDPRRFGGVWMFASRDELPPWQSLGPDALAITPNEFAARLHGAKRPIKAALLDQGLVAGIGNIYADEALHRAGIHPLTQASSLLPDRLERLGAAVVELLQDAVAVGGSTLRDYRAADGEPGGYQHAHRVYGRSDLECLTCGRGLSTARIAQRTTVWCPGCQEWDQPAPDE